MVNITITIGLKDGVLDPEGRAIESSLNNLGYHEASEIKTGRLIRFTMNENDHARVHQKVSKMCETLLVNTVIEHYDITIDDLIKE